MFLKKECLLLQNISEKGMLITAKCFLKKEWLILQNVSLKGMHITAETNPLSAIKTLLFFK